MRSILAWKSDDLYFGIQIELDEKLARHTHTRWRKIGIKFISLFGLTYRSESPTAVVNILRKKKSSPKITKKKPCIKNSLFICLLVLFLKQLKMKEKTKKSSTISNIKRFQPFSFGSQLDGHRERKRGEARACGKWLLCNAPSTFIPIKW